MSKVKTWSTTAASNNAASPDGWPENMPPSGVNNSAREMMAEIREVWNDKEWFELGSGSGTSDATRASTTSITIAADVTSSYHVGRRVKIYGANTGTIYGKIATSAYSAPNTTVSFTLDSGTIHSSDTTPRVWVGSTYVGPATPVVDEDAMGSDSAVLPPSQQSVKAFVTSGTVTQSNKSIALGSNTVTGTTAQFNTALTDNDFATLAGSETLTNKTLTSPVLNTGISGTALQDDDNFSSASASKVASSESIKAYVDSQVTAQDLDITTDSGNIDIDLDSESLTLTGGTGIDTSATGSTVTHAIDSTVVTKTGTQTLTNKTINASNNTLSNIGNSALSNSSVNFGGVSVSLGASDTTPAFDLSDATSYPTSSLTGTISNAQVASGVDAAKIADGSVSNTEFQYISTLSSNAQTQLTGKLTASNNLSDVAAASTARTNLGLGTIATQASNNVSISGGGITGISNPSNNLDVSNKQYVDNAIAGLRNRTVADCASTANVNISNALEAGDSIDGVTLTEGMRVLLKDQSTATENGLYLAVASSAGAASRDPEHDTLDELSGGMIVVNQGSANNDKIFLCTTDNSGSIGSTNITYTQVTPSNTGTVTSVTLGQSGSEFTIGGTNPITSSGTVTIDVNRIAATKIGADTSVSNTEFGYLANVSSDIQTQIDNKAGAGFAVAMAIAL
ncbi:MAG: hypothetical protein CMQ38_04170 [Gammaproteobacteria bacterium]|nr:hypothetical protein [Gammaproteobacteria bacterium]